MSTIRLDKYLSLAGVASRTETSKAVRGGEVLVDGIPAKKADVQVDPDTVSVIFKGQPVVYRQFTYILMHKPDGVVSATEDGREKTVLDLLPEELRRIRPALFPCGRLDKHTTGLMLLTNNGDLSHRLLSPARHVDKTYAFSVKFPLSEEDVSALEAGVDIGGYVTAPCRVELDPKNPDERGSTGRITLHEGKYHQIKLMMEARHNQITKLMRMTFGPLILDPALAAGEWRLLTEDEIAALESR
jgi:16S rRNA pseudouridine516 synthase